MTPKRSSLAALLPILLGTLFAASSARAQVVPTTINYQGRLTDNSVQQVPIDGVVSMRFEIWDGPGALGAVRVWREPDCDGCGVDVLVTKGIFNFVLGSSSPLSPSLFTDGTPRWLEIILHANSSNAENLTPRQRLMSTAYAMRAEAASTAEVATKADVAATAEHANDADRAFNSDALEGLPAAAFQKAISTPNCPMGFFYSAIATDGTALCAPPASQSGVHSVNPAGGVTASIAGTQLNIGTDSTIQRRLSAPTCPNGQFLLSIAVDGTPTCAADAGAAAPLDLSASLGGAVISGTNSGLGSGLFGRSLGAASGVRGQTQTGIGTEGIAIAQGTGVSGLALPSSGPSFGVTGTSNSPGGAGVRAIGSPSLTGPALQIEQGGIRVVGAGFNTPTAAFVHTVNLWVPPEYQGIANCIDHPLTNNRPDALLFLTQRYIARYEGFFESEVMGIHYSGNYANEPCPLGQWVITGELDEGKEINILVIVP